MREDCFYHCSLPLLPEVQLLSVLPLVVLESCVVKNFCSVARPEHALQASLQKHPLLWRAWWACWPLHVRVLQDCWTSLLLPSNSLSHRLWVHPRLNRDGVSRQRIPPHQPGLATNSIFFCLLFVKNHWFAWRARKILFSSVPPSNSLASVLDPWRALDSPCALLPELQRIKDTVRSAVLGAEVPGHQQEPLPKTLIVFVVPKIAGALALR